MAATAFTANGGVQTVANTVNTVSLQPDLIWLKNRGAVANHFLFNTVVGVSAYLNSDSTSSEGTNVNFVTGANSTGFSLGTSNYTNGSTVIGWQWNAGGTTVTNGVGTISSQVRANTTAGFSVVTYTGTGANATVGHGLGVVPGMVIIKSRSIRNWIVYHSSLTSAAYYLSLNQTIAQSLVTTIFNSTAPTNAVFNIGTDASVNALAETYVAYCWAPVAGYSAFGSYTGNGSADGPFIYTGFRPRWLMIKRTDATLSWGIFDTSRNAFNVVDLQLYANLSVADNVFTTMDILSNGFKSRSATEYNTSGGTYIYAAFAENPLKYANAR